MRRHRDAETADGLRRHRANMIQIVNVERPRALLCVRCRDGTDHRLILALAAGLSPGQACAYMIGQLKIVDLREKIRARLGDKFSIKAFHNAVLKVGSVPLSALEAEMERAFP